MPAVSTMGGTIRAEICVLAMVAAALAYAPFAMGANDTAGVPVFREGAIGVDTSTFYYWLTQAMDIAQSDTTAPNAYCYQVPAVASLGALNTTAGLLALGVPEAAVAPFAETLPSNCASEKIATSECTRICAEWGIVGWFRFSECPLNVLGCCSCDYFHPKINTQSLANTPGAGCNPTTENVAWAIIPGWFNMAAWTLLGLMLMPLVYIRATGKQNIPGISLWVDTMRVVSFIGMGMYVGWMVIWLLGLNCLGTVQYYFAFDTSRAGVFMHVLGGSVWLFASILQFIGALRKRLPTIHKIVGYVAVTFQLVASIGLIMLLLSPHISGIGGTVIGFMFVAYWWVCLFLGVRHAIKRDIDSHRRWMTRNTFNGASVIFQRIFNALSPYMFGSSEYYVGNLYAGLCGAGGVESVVVSTGNSNFQFSKEVVSYGCAGIDTLQTHMAANWVFFFVFVAVAIFGCEIWLWATGQQAYQVGQERTSNIPVLSAPVGPLNVLREVSGMEIELAEKTQLADGLYLLRFRLPNKNPLGADAVLVPTLGHVNLSSIDTGANHRPRPFSPIRGLEGGHVTFLVRDAGRKGLSTYMCQVLEQGGRMRMDGPFAAAEHDPQTKVLLIAAGTGLAPLLPLARSLLAAHESDPWSFQLLYRDRKARSADLAWLLGLEPATPEISRLNSPGAVETDHPSVQTLFTKEEFDSAVSAALAKGAFGSVVVCGPPSFNFAMKRRLRKLRTGLSVACIGTDDR